MHRLCSHQETRHTGAATFSRRCRAVFLCSHCFLITFGACHDYLALAAVNAAAAALKSVSLAYNILYARLFVASKRMPPGQNSSSSNTLQQLHGKRFKPDVNGDVWTATLKFRDFFYCWAKKQRKTSYSTVIIFRSRFTWRQTYSRPRHFVSGYTSDEIMNCANGGPTLRAGGENARLFICQKIPRRVVGQTFMFSRACIDRKLIVEGEKNG